MQSFVARQNIQHFRELLATEADPARRAMLASLISEEEAKLTRPDGFMVQGDPQDRPRQQSDEIDRAQQQADLANAPKR
jgi:hypothetical protein